MFTPDWLKDDVIINVTCPSILRVFLRGFPRGFYETLNPAKEGAKQNFEQMTDTGSQF